MEYKHCDFDFKEFGEQPGTFVGLAGVYEDKDLQGEIIDAGAFKNATSAVILWSHLTHEVLGSTSHVTEVGKALSIGAGLELEVQRAREAYALIKNKHIKGLSVGFITKKDYWHDGVRHIAEAELKEVSITAFPAQPLAAIQNVKEAIEPELKAGRILSKITVDKIRAAIDSLSALIDGATPEAPKEEGPPEIKEDEGEPLLDTKPYPNEHACRLREPGAFQDNSFRRVTRNSDGKQYSIIMGRLTGSTSMTEQAYRYAKDEWTADAARAHCSSHDGSFEAAATRDEATELAIKEYKSYLEKLNISALFDAEPKTPNK